jgi:hypothetical protein
MVSDADGEIADVIALENRAVKGKSGRVICGQLCVGFRKTVVMDRIGHGLFIN